MANLSPSITFTVKLATTTTEAIGPNSTTVGMYNPDMSQSSPDLGRTQLAARTAERSTWLPCGTFPGQNKVAKNGDSFTLYGLQALYVRNMYGIGYAPADRAYLTVTVN